MKIKQKMKKIISFILPKKESPQWGTNLNSVVLQDLQEFMKRYQEKKK